MTEPLVSLAPLVSSQTRLLILGSFPGVASLKAQQYYGHPQNHFWRILQAIIPPIPVTTGASSYQIRSDWLLSKGLGLWDVYASCEREGSLDSSIRNAVLNDFSVLKRLCPNLRAIAHNGGESFKHSKPTQTLGLPVYRLPSTSPANASWSFERKLAAWREVFEKHGLI
ncbi:MAG: DNA-deoxyinosine glycosylase [Polaromonas sp.]|nr:DNA-deoxyinosine glycosylase [Polaromonas sp.]